ncbi:ribonuclease E [Corynebacterium resistens DSM 45100]|uniref:Ribonuclease E n=1 Tax=Corynebacterium resistens (strain DSM 45100 / JCM 12819 / GTC 2026 / SICGH 158) TaxID=662755 RepID=F8DZ57_CORRG|nr:Rne/Rng family ribonuclease [Corynebacterium resistens]AEI08998.1 ribonuclease E [Corynebacterium resistens DSM 45100]
MASISQELAASAAQINTEEWGPKVRIHQLAKQLGLRASELLPHIESTGIEGKKVQSSLTKQEATDVVRALSSGDDATSGSATPSAGEGASDKKGSVENPEQKAKAPAKKRAPKRRGKKAAEAQPEHSQEVQPENTEEVQPEKAEESKNEEPAKKAEESKNEEPAKKAEEARAEKPAKKTEKTATKKTARKSAKKAETAAKNKAADEPAKKSGKKAEAKSELQATGDHAETKPEPAEHAVTEAIAPHSSKVAAEEEDQTATRRRRRVRRVVRRVVGRPAGVATGQTGKDSQEQAETGGEKPTKANTKAKGKSKSEGKDKTQPKADQPKRKDAQVEQPEKPAEELHPAERHASDVVDQPVRLKGSTRLASQRQWRRENRERNHTISRSAFLARRESVERKMVVRDSHRSDHQGLTTQVGVVEDGMLVEHFVTSETQQSMVGNIYLGRVQNVLSSMEAAFVDIGTGRNAVLYAGEMNWHSPHLHSKNRRIDQALRAGDQILVQVIKDPVGHKGARLSNRVSFAGRYLVYFPEGTTAGISRKLPEPERKRLKEILANVIPGDGGAIIRTAAENVPEEQIGEDVARLHSLWEKVSKEENKARSRKGAKPITLYEEPNMLVKVVRDIFNEDFKELIVDGAKSWQVVRDYVARMAPDLQDRLTKWNPNKHEGEDVFAAMHLDEQLTKALSRKVWLPSGGYLIIDPTEAMTVIDVNTGSFVGAGGNLEETVTQNNLEAAEEIVRQMRLRDLGGMIVVDFIDMVLEENRDLVLRRLTEYLGRDRTRHKVSEVTSLGLVQMTRKRLGTGLLETFSTVCAECEGRGVIIHSDPVEQDFDEAPRRDHGGRKDRQQARRERATRENIRKGAAESTGDNAEHDDSGHGGSSHRGKRRAPGGAHGGHRDNEAGSARSERRRTAAHHESDRAGSARRQHDSSDQQSHGQDSPENTKTTATRRVRRRRVVRSISEPRHQSENQSADEVLTHRRNENRKAHSDDRTQRRRGRQHDRNSASIDDIAASALRTAKAEDPDEPSGADYMPNDGYDQTAAHNQPDERNQASDDNQGRGRVDTLSDNGGREDTQPDKRAARSRSSSRRRRMRRVVRARAMQAGDSGNDDAGQGRRNEKQTYEQAKAEFDASPRRKRQTRGNSRSDVPPRPEEFEQSGKGAGQDRGSDKPAGSTRSTRQVRQTRQVKRTNTAISGTVSGGRGTRRVRRVVRKTT